MAKNISYLLLSLFLFAIIYISFFNRFQTDDFVLAHQIIKSGNLKAFIDGYMNWSGRYFSFLLSRNTSLVFGDYELYPVAATIFSMVALLLAAFICFKKFSDAGLAQNIFKAVSFCAIYFALTINIGEHIYWNAGSKIYFFPFIYSLFLMVSLKKSAETDQFAYKVLNYLLVFIIVGSNEIIATMLLTALVFFCLHKKSRYLVGLTTFAFFCFLALILAPGNFARANGSLQIFSMKKPGVFLCLVLLAFFKCVPLLPLAHQIFNRELAKFKNLKMIYFLWLVPMSGIFAIAFLLSTTTRTYDTFLIFFFAALCVTSFRYFDLKKIAAVSWLFLCLPSIYLPPKKFGFFEFNYHLNDAASDIFSGNLASFKSQMMAREELLRKSPSQIIILKPISKVPKTLYFSEIPDAEHKNFVNNIMVNFYAKKEVTTERQDKPINK